MILWARDDYENSCLRVIFCDVDAIFVPLGKEGLLHGITREVRNLCEDVHFRFYSQVRFSCQRVMWAISLMSVVALISIRTEILKTIPLTCRGKMLWQLSSCKSLAIYRIEKPSNSTDSEHRNFTKQEFGRIFCSEERKGTNSMGQTGFCENLRFPAVFCKNLRPRNAVIPKKSENQRKTANLAHLSLLVCPFYFPLILMQCDYINYIKIFQEFNL